MFLKSKRRGTFRLKAGDIVIVTVVVCAAVTSMVLVAGAGANREAGLAVIEVNGEVVQRIELGRNQPHREYTVQGWNGPSTIEVEDGRIHMKESTCRDKICVGTGWVDTPARSIVCMPNRVVIYLSGEGKPSGVDTVTE